jgi:DNA-binding IclR family transcriptional regulator
VRLERGVTVAALSIAVPTSRYGTHGDILSRAVTETADAISRTLRHTVSEEREAAVLAVA